MEFYPPINEWRVPQDLLQISVSEMKQDGQRGNEGTSLWLGHKEEGVATITHAVLLRGRHIVKRPNQIQIQPELMREVHQACRQLRLILVGQIHSHGEFYGEDLSWIDRAAGFRIPSFLSVVAPDYGLTWPISWFDCGVHIYERSMGFLRLSHDDIRERLIETNARTTTLTVSVNE